MPSDQSLLERQIERVELRPFTLERFHRRRQRKERNQRIGAAVVALAVAAAGIGVLARAFSSRTVPASDPSLGVFEPIAGRIVYVNEGVDRGYDAGIWAVDPSGPFDTTGGPSVADDVASTLVRLGLEDAIPLGWSSDGTELLFMREDLDTPFPYQDELFILHADGSETQLNTDSRYIEGATIAPDGSRVVFAAAGGPYFPYNDVDADPGLFVVDTDGSRPVPIPYPSAPPGGDPVSSPTFSPDGTRIAYLVRGFEDDGLDVWVANADGSNAREILADEPAVAEGVSRLVWSPAGDRIAMDNSLGRVLEIYTFAPDGSDFTTVITGGMNPFWAPDGSQIAYMVPHDPPPGVGPSGLAIADADGSNVREFGFAASGPWHPARANPTTENGEALAEPYEFLDGEVTFAAAPPWKPSVAGWDHSPTMTVLDFDDGLGTRLTVLAEPRPIERGCAKGGAATDAEALARTIRSDPDLEATEPVAAEIGGIDALRLDVVAAPGASVCADEGSPQVMHDLNLGPVAMLVGHRMRLYLLDLPGGSGRILAIAISAPEDRFETVLEAAEPVVDSFEFHTR